MNKATNLVIDLAEQLKNDIIRWRRHLHSIPERSFEEHETAEYVAKILESFGYRVRRGVAGTGVIAEIGSGPAVAVRAELDGLMLDERNRVEYASRNKMMMHACGHDANMAAVLACASMLKELKPNGCVRIVMQPASEVAADEQLKSGALRMIEEGVLDNVIAVIGMHVDSTIDSGKIGVIAEPVVFQSESFSISLVKNEEAAKRSDDTFFDAVDAGAKIVTAIYIETSSLARELSLQPVKVLSLRSLEKEGKSQEARIRGKITSNSKQMFNSISEQIKRACELSKSLDCDYSLNFEATKSEGAMNPIVVELMKQASIIVAGQDNVLVLKRKTWAEDFSTFSARKPGAMVLLGTRVQGPPRSHHSDTFDVDESTLHLGAAILAQGALSVLEHPELSDNE